MNKTRLSLQTLQISSDNKEIPRSSSEHMSVTTYIFLSIYKYLKRKNKWEKLLSALHK